jgi:ribosome biogenesis GTPase
LNRLLGGERQRTGTVRESDSRGRHTTTSRELIVLPNGAAIIDSPGLREIQLLVGEDALDAVFDEIAALAAECRFGDCSHTTEPGCAVVGAVSEDRLVSFHKLQRESERLRGERTEKLRWRAIHKAAKRFYKERGR